MKLIEELGAELVKRSKSRVSNEAHLNHKFHCLFYDVKNRTGKMRFKQWH